MVRIAVVDTGYGPSPGDVGTHICPSGHRDFTNDEANKGPWDDKNLPVDHHGHGTHIAGLIHQAFVGDMLGSSLDASWDNREKRNKVFKHLQYGSERENYCLVILKYYDPTDPKSDNLKNTVKAFLWAAEIHVDVINYSGGGLDFSVPEHDAVEAAIDAGIVFVAAAGNEYSNSSKSHYYPGNYERVINVGSVDKHGKPLKSSNWGPLVTVWERGENIFSSLPNNRYGTMTGTSQATAIHAGKIARELWDEENDSTKKTCEQVKGITPNDERTDRHPPEDQGTQSDSQRGSRGWLAYIAEYARQAVER
jgi:subtilisin family serine protease